jgi:hypothetical protein
MSNIGLYQNVKITYFDKDWNYIREGRTHNLILSTGLDLIRNHLMSTLAPLTPYKFMLGTGTTAVVSTDTGLQSSNYNISFTGSTLRSAGVTFEGYIYTTDGVGSTWNELGIFTSSSEIIGRTLIVPIIKTSSNPTNEFIEWAFDLTAST